MPSPTDSLKATVNLRVEGTPEVRDFTLQEMIVESVQMKV
jgi:hypothetical protein